MPDQPEERLVTNGCRIVIDLVGVGQREDFPDMPEAYEVTVKRDQLPPSDVRAQETWQNDDVTSVRSSWPDTSLSAAAGAVANWAASAWRNDIRVMGMEHRAEKREERKRKASGD
jgi:hypothetical protein